MAQSPKGRLIQGLYKPIQGNCAIYFYPGVTGMILQVSKPPSVLLKNQVAFGSAADLAIHLCTSQVTDGSMRRVGRVDLRILHEFGWNSYGW